MIHSDIIRIAAGCGWQVSITACGDNSFYFDFQRMHQERSAVQFHAAMTGGRISSLVDEIVSFVDALDPERYACEWMENKGDVSPARYLKTIDGMDEMRTHAWLLAVELSTAAERKIPSRLAVVQSQLNPKHNQRSNFHSFNPCHDPLANPPRGVFSVFGPSSEGRSACIR